MKLHLEARKVCLETLGTMEDGLQKILRDRFGLQEFRPGQHQVMQALMEGRSALAVFPTGGGKSLCYQLPALLLEGLTLVVSPLIALMRDQVEALGQLGVEAARLDSSLGAAEVAAVYERVREGSLKLLYVAPERLSNEGFLRELQGIRLSLLAVDEAHCISEWGHNFRPDYLKLSRLARELKVERVLALTATATPRVSEEICREFGIAAEDHVQTGFRRDNLSFAVWPCRTEERDELLLRRFQEWDGAPGAAIVYVTLQQTAEEVAGRLSAAGLQAKAYHAGLPDEYRMEVQDAFMSGDVEVVVATIAFGMGIDKADIRRVYHYNLPKSLEHYVQESGRAGRDGDPADCEIFACGDDRVVLENFTYGDTPSVQALRQLLEHLLLQGEEFSISRYELSVTNDIRPLVVATVLTYLELQGLLEATGPFYARYQVQLPGGKERMLAGRDREHQRFLQRLLETGKKGRIWITLDIDESARRMEVPEQEIRQALRDLEEAGDAVLKASALRHGYRLLGEEKPDVGAMVRDMESLFQIREQGEIERLERIISFCESGRCRAAELVTYFGDDLDEPCGHCDNCRGQNGGAVLPSDITEELSLQEVALMQEVRAENHAALRQPRQLTRFLCGISSPASNRARLSRHDQFGCLSHKPFPVVLAQAESLGG